MNRREFIAGTILAAASGFCPPAFARALALPKDSNCDLAARDNLPGRLGINETHEMDVFLDSGDLPVLASVVARLKRVRRTMGYGNFSLMGFDDAVSNAAAYSSIGAFTPAEVAFMERLFYEDASIYGFLGEKKLLRITDTIRLKNIVKIPGTGNCLYRGTPLATYKKIKADVGKDAVLTSGLRGIVKQMLLFLSKAQAHEGNLSLASRSLAPPGYSYHGVGDFDVGKIGFGIANFTERFTTTRVYSSLVDTGYVKLRYTRGNRLGVRFEPWHIKVVAS
ncbi:MAG: M15 family metallopeptidase [Desulfobacterium sp.]|nr:M15 family metallopeptidase [Desulfobacterium sp.]